MSVVTTAAGFGIGYYPIYVFDITTGTGSSQMFLLVSPPGDGVLGEADADTLLAAMQSAIEELDGVTACEQNLVTLSASDPWTQAGAPGIAFDESWPMFGYTMTHPGTLFTQFAQAWFASAAPADGNWDEATVEAVATAVQTAAEGLVGFTGCTKAPRPTVSPATV